MRLLSLSKVRRLPLSMSMAGKVEWEAKGSLLFQKTIRDVQTKRPTQQQPPNPLTRLHPRSLHSNTPPPPTRSRTSPKGMQPHAKAPRQRPTRRPRRRPYELHPHLQRQSSPARGGTGCRSLWYRHGTCSVSGWERGGDLYARCEAMRDY